MLFAFGLSLLPQRLQNFSVSIEVDSKYYPKIIGRKGAIITKIKEDHKVKSIQFADRHAANPNLITVVGYERNALAARDAIMDIVHNLVSCREERSTGLPGSPGMSRDDLQPS